MTRRLVLALAGAALAVVGAAGPAAADPAKPTDYRSAVTSISPSGVGGFDIDVVGGDGFLDLRVDAGHDVVVLGYDDEPWLHIGADGTVEQNIHSSATYLNADRYAQVAEPDLVDPDADPEFERIGGDGRYVWHDHRIHWMSPDRPAGRSAGDTVFDDWMVPMTVDGTDVVVHGSLVWEQAASPLPWIVALVLGAAGLLVAARALRGRPVLVASIGALVAAVLAVVVGLGQRAATPDAAGGTPLVFVVPLVALVAAVAAVVLHRRPVAVVCLLAAVAALAGWALLRLSVLTHPVLPTTLPFALDRAGTGLALAVATAGAYLAVQSGALRPIDADADTDAGGGAAGGGERFPEK